MAFKLTSGLIVLATMFAASTALPIVLRDFNDLEAMDLEARQDALSCYPVDVNQIKSLPAWGKIEQYARDTWGNGGWNIVTNPSEYPDRALQVCVKTSKVNTQFTEKPQCVSDRHNIEGQSTGATSEITFTTKRGSSQTSTWTVTRSSTIASSVKFTLSVGIPTIGTGGAETSISTEIRNERSSAFTGTVNNEESVMMKFSNEPGKQCKVDLLTETCTAKASGRVPVIADGFVWFNYKDKRAPKNDPNGSKHYKYAASINGILSEDERTTFIEFQGPVNSKSSSTYKTNCVDIGQPLPIKAATPAESTASKSTASASGTAVKIGSKPTTGKKPAAASKPATGKKPATKSTPTKSATKSSSTKNPATKATPAKKPAAKSAPAKKSTKPSPKNSVAKE
ncbi:hypothetical protein FA13DRAFT_1093267 [Coprinellus micaceus]|uniref:Uncharacterized protein n=1 Tax=Coprinellus micaceus TaxID=71717 RepID=A0A4Y7TS63_COPMI|nr:hypothetical protein FA13DRAFT_1093267 [Coprinellus micaceus]